MCELYNAEAYHFPWGTMVKSTCDSKRKKQMKIKFLTDLLMICTALYANVINFSNGI